MRFPILPLLILSLATAVAARAQDVQGHGELVRALTSRYGPYDLRVAEALTGLGLQTGQQGRYAEAAHDLRRAWHIQRVNLGLHDPGQVPALELLIRATVAGGDWDGTSTLYRYFGWLQRRNASADDPRLVEALSRLGRWHLSLASFAPLQSSARHYSAAEDNFRAAAWLSRRQFGGGDPRELSALRGLSRAAMGLVALVPNPAQLGARPEPGRYGARALEPRPAPMALHDRLYAAPRVGMQALGRALSVGGETPGNRARTLALLGDWDLVYGDPAAAHARYAEAHAAAGEQAGELFATPVALAAPLRADPPMAFDAPIAPGHVVISHGVDENGHTSHPRIERVEGRVSRASRSRALALVERHRFRPRLVDGRPVSSEGLMAHVRIYE